jgi:hypothetical protein
MRERPQAVKKGFNAEDAKDAETMQPSAISAPSPRLRINLEGA